MQPIQTVDVRGKISTHVFEQMMRDVRLLEATGTTPMIDISSPGGCSLTSRQMFDFLEPRKLTTISRGLVASAGVLVFLAGKRRWIKANANIHLHSGAFTPETVDWRPELLEEADRRYATIVSQRTGLFTTDEILSNMKATITLNARSAVRYGFAHEIID